MACRGLAEQQGLQYGVRLREGQGDTDHFCVGERGMTMDRMAEIKARCKAATPGAWKHRETADYSEIYAASDPLALVGSSTDDAEFIAHAREDIPYLLEQLEEAQRETERLREAHLWIPVDVMLPDNEKHDWVLAQVVEDNGFRWLPRVMEYRERLSDWYDSELGWMKEERNKPFTVTHWMPLPEPPEGE